MATNFKRGTGMKKPNLSYFFKCTCFVLIELNRRNAILLLLAGKFTIKLQMESILWSSFTAVSGKWELCFHGHKQSNSFTAKKFLSSSVLTTSEIFVLPWHLSENCWVQNFSFMAFEGHLNPPLFCFLGFSSMTVSWGFLEKQSLGKKLKWCYIIDNMNYFDNMEKWKKHVNVEYEYECKLKMNLIIFESWERSILTPSHTWPAHTCLTHRFSVPLLVCL